MSDRGVECMPMAFKRVVDQTPDSMSINETPKMQTALAHNKRHLPRARECS